MLDDLGNTGNRETPIVLAILVTEDLVMAFYLPLMAGLLIGGNTLQVGIDVMVAVAAVVTALLLAIKFGDRISSVVFTRSDENLLLTMLGLGLLVAGLSQKVQAWLQSARSWWASRSTDRPSGSPPRCSSR